MALAPINFSVPNRAPDPIEQAFSAALMMWARNKIEEPFQKRAEARELTRTVASEARANERQRQNLVFTQNLSNANIGPSTQLTSEARQDVLERSGQLLSTANPETARFMREAEAELGSPIPTTRDVRSGTTLFNLPSGFSSIPVARPERTFISSEAAAAARAAMAPASADQIATARALRSEVNRVLSRGTPPLPDISATHTIRTATGAVAPIVAPELFGLGPEAAPLEGQVFTESSHPTSLADIEGVVRDTPARLDLLTRLGTERREWAGLAIERARGLYQSTAPLTPALEEYFAGRSVVDPENPRGRPLTLDEKSAVINYQVYLAAEQNPSLSQAERTFAHERVTTAVRVHASSHRASGVLTAAEMQAFHTSARQTSGNATQEMQLLQSIAPPLANAGVIVDENSRPVTEPAKVYAAITANPALREAVYARYRFPTAALYNANLEQGGLQLSGAAESILQQVYRYETPAGQNEDRWRISGAAELAAPVAVPRRRSVLDRIMGLSSRREQEQDDARAAAAAAGIAPVSLAAPAAWAPPASRVTPTSFRGAVGVTAPPILAPRGTDPAMYSAFYSWLNASPDPTATYDSLAASIRTNLATPAAAAAGYRRLGLSDTTLARLTTGSQRSREQALRILRNDALTSLMFAQQALADSLNH